MAFQRIRIKNTNVSGKIPGADKLDVAELCVNLKDQKLYSKDADGNVFELGGKVDSGITPPPGPGGNNIGDLFWDGDFLLVWNGNEWVPVGAADLDYTPAPDKGTITNTAGDDVDLPLVDDTNAGLMSPDEHKKLDGMPVIISGDQFPGTPELGDIWIDTNLCPPSINIWNDCEDPGNPEWTPIGGGDPTGCQQGGVAIAGDTEIGSTLTATGGRGLDAGELLPEPIYNWTGPNGFTATGTEIVATEEGNYTVTATITCLDGTDLETSATKTISDSYVDMVNNTSPIIAVLGELPDGAYSGNSLYVATNATVNNGDNPVIVENRWYRDSSQVSTDQLYTISAADPEGSVLTCRQLFRDARTNEILSDASNGITIVARPADAITFTPVITDDGTPNANTPGHVLTASAQNIVGGTAPIEYEYKWLVEGLTMGANKTLNIIQTFIGKIVSCEVTVAEPDGTNPETRTAVYSKVIEIAGTINTPEVLAPADGAGSGDVRYLKSDAITEVEGGGIDICETELIESVDDTTDAPNVILTFPDNKGFDCFEPNDPTNGQKQVDVTGFTYERWGELDTTNGNHPSSAGVETGKQYTDATFGQVPTGSNTPGSGGLYMKMSQPVSAIKFGYSGGGSEQRVGEIYGSTDGKAWTLLDGGYMNVGKSQKLDSGDTAYRYFNFTLLNKTGDLSDLNQNKSSEDFTISNYGITDEAIINVPVLVVSKEPDAVPPTITVDGGDWSDGTSAAGQWQKAVWSSQVTEIVGQRVGNQYTAEALYDGTSYLTHPYGLNAKEFKLNFNPPLSGTVEIECHNVGCTLTVNDDTANANLVDQGTLWTETVDGTYPEKSKVVFDSNTYPTISSLKFEKASGNSACYTVRLDGNLLVDATGDTTVKGKTTSWDTTLTLAGPTDLDVLQVGDVVKMGLDADVPYQPVSDSIVNVDDQSVSFYMVRYSNETNNSGADLNTLPTWDSAIEEEGPIEIGTYPTSSGQRSAQLYDFGAPTAFVWAKKNLSGGTGNPGDAIFYSDDTITWTLDRFLESGEGKNRPYYSTLGEKHRYWAAQRGSNTWIKSNYSVYEAATQIELTLSGATDLSYFRVGDMVQGATVEASDTYVLSWKSQGNTYSPNAYSTGSGGTKVDVNFGSRPSGTGSGVNHIYFDLRKPLKNIEMINFTGSTGGAPGPWSYYGTNDPDDASSWEVIVNKQSSINGPDSGNADPIINADKAYRYLCLASSGNMNSENYGIDAEILDNQSHIIDIDETVPSITVNGGEWDPAGVTGDAEVTCVSPLKAPTNWKVERIHEDDNKLDLSHATPDDNAQVWVANDNQAGTDFNVTADRTIVDEPLLTADVRLESSLFATTPADSDTLKNIVWELNGVEQNAGTSNPYTPTGLALNTEYTVRVKHQGNALDDSAWSTPTTFTTGATRNLYTYYKERVEVLENRLAGLEADEVVDDATDVTLLTVVADLIQRVETLENP